MIFLGYLDDVPTRIVRHGIPSGGAAVVRLGIVAIVALVVANPRDGPHAAVRRLRLERARLPRREGWGACHRHGVTALPKNFACALP